MSVSKSSHIEGLLDQLKGWPSSDRLRLARRILETLEAPAPEAAPPAPSLRSLLGLLRTDSPPPTEEECQALLEEELAKKHGR